MAEDHKLIAYTKDDWTMPIEPAPLERDWMTQELNGHPYHCLPLNIANQSGWVLRNIVDFSVVWRGGVEKQSTKITYAGAAPDFEYFSSHFGFGIITLSPPYLFRTPPNYNLRIGGVPNMFKDGVQALEGIVETDWSPMPFTINLKITRPDTEITFRKGEALCFICPQLRGEVEKFDPQILPMADEQDLPRNKADFIKKCQFNHYVNEKIKHKTTAGESLPKAFYDRDYFEGRTVDGTRQTETHAKRVRVKPFIQGVERP